MSLTENQISLVRGSFALLRDQIEPRSLGLYSKLFRYDPALRKLFKGDIGDQAMHYMTALGVIVDNLDDDDVLMDRYISLAEQHAMTGIGRADFETMGAALIETLRDNLAEAFTEEVEEAWNAAYQDLAGEMMEIGRIR